MKVRTLLPAVLIALVASSFLGLAKTDAGSYGNGLCSSTPENSRTCQHNYVHQNHVYHYFEVRANDCAQCTGTYLNHFNLAKANWGQVPGPQYFVTTVPSGFNYTTVFMKQYPGFSDPEGNMASGTKPGYARNRRTNNTVCLSLATPCVVWYSDVYINMNLMQSDSLGNPQSEGYRQGNFAHEFGHVLGLAHFPTTDALMYASLDGVPSGPVAVDYGTSSTCSGSSSSYTVRCIYVW